VTEDDLSIYNDVLSRPYNMSIEQPFTDQYSLIQATSNSDKLYSHIDMEIQAHDNRIINSYVKDVGFYMGLRKWAMCIQAH